MPYTQPLARVPRAARSVVAAAAAVAATPKCVRSVLKTVVAMCMSAVVTASPVFPSPSPSALPPLESIAGTNWFHCTMNVVVEDYYEEHAHFTYARCTGADDTSVIIPVDHDQQFPFAANEKVAVALDDATTTASLAEGTLRVDADSVFALHQSAPADVVIANRRVAVHSDVSRRERAELEPIYGERSVLILRVKYNGAEADYCDDKCVANAIVEADSAYQSMSGGKVSFPREMAMIANVEVTGGKYGASGCDYWNIGLEAERAAKAAGIPVRDYQHTVFYLPRQLQGAKCTFGGLAFMGCSYPTCRVWVRNEHPATLAHELGHNLNSKHSAADWDNDGKTDNEYGDNSDLMGFQKYWRGMNAPHQVLFGWMDELHIARFNNDEGETSNQCSVETVTQVTLAPLYDASSAVVGAADKARGRRAVAATATQVAIFPRSASRNADESDGAGRYYLSYRTPAGIDELFGEPGVSSKNMYADKVALHYTFDALGLKQDTKLVTVLSAGDVYTDAESKVSITVVSTNGLSGAMVELTTCLGDAATTSTTTASPAPVNEELRAPDVVGDATIGKTETAAAAGCNSALDRFSVVKADTRGNPNKKISQEQVEGGEEGCGAACVANVKCVGFAYSWRSKTCRHYRTTTKTVSKSDSTWFVRDDHCASVTVVAAAVEQRAQCLAFTPFKARPLCGASAPAGGDGSECCPGTECMGRKNRKGVKVHRCDIRVPRRSQKVDEVCTVNKHCSRGLKCDTGRFVCYDKSKGLPEAPPGRFGRSVDGGGVRAAAATAGSATNALVYACAAFGLVSVGIIYGALVIRGQRKNGACSTASVPTMDGSVLALMHSIEVAEDEPAIYDFKAINRELAF